MASATPSQHATAKLYVATEQRDTPAALEAFAAGADVNATHVLGAPLDCSILRLALLSDTADVALVRALLAYSK